MAIQEGNIKLVKSQVMDDVSEGGGQATGTVIQDGASNSIFPDISELDRAYGRVNLRKTFVSVSTPDTDGYYGANVIVADPPDDGKVSCSLFSTESGFDTRTEAQARLESYVIAGPLSTMRLYGSQYVGAKAVLTYQREDEALPEAGDVIALSEETAQGVSTYQQFVRITDVSYEIRTFSDSIGDYKRRVLTLKISDQLRKTFTGAEPSRMAYDPSPTKVRETTAADTAKYYGVVPLAAQATTGALACQVDTIYTQLVPSSTAEAPISMAQIGTANNLLAAASATTTESASISTGTQTRRTLRPIKPGTLSLAVGSSTATDDGFGGLTGGLVSGGTAEAAIDYESGVITFNCAAAGTLLMTYMPAGDTFQSAHTAKIDVTLATRGTVYVRTLRPLPAPGTVELSYMSLGKWYRLRDTGAGQLEGANPSIGTGSIDYSNGALVVTLGALPDVDSAILVSWGSPSHYEVNTTADLRIDATLPNTPVVPGTLSIGWVSGGAAKTATADNQGVITGDGATGTVNHTTGEISMTLTGAADISSDVSFDYSYRAPNDPQAPVKGFDIVAAAASMIASAAIDSGSLKMNLPLKTSDNQEFGRASCTDDGAGGLVIKAGQYIGRAFIQNQQIIGTVNYATGEIAVTTAPIGKVNKSTLEDVHDGVGFVKREPVWGLVDDSLEIDTAETATLAYKRAGAATDTASTYVAAAADIKPIIRLAAGASCVIVPGSVLISAAGKKYIDRDGTLYADVSATTGSGIVAGTINYQTREAQISYWQDGAAFNLSVLACLTSKGDFVAGDATFRTSGAPIRTASFYVQVTAADGTLLTATANNSGIISGSHVRGEIVDLTGVVWLEFGDTVADVWVPYPVLPDTLRYNAVALTSLPLDADILGLDPVRLPSDGRVPIIRAGDIAVVHHTAATAAASVSNGQTVDCGRVRLSRVRVIGNDGATITTGYTADLDAGTVTFTDVAGYSQPVVIEHRIEDMALVSDAQISGDVAFTRQLTHDFPLGSYLSSALIIGDMRARVPVFFDQATWSGAWADIVSGSNASASYNNVLYPIAVTNQGAITERWAIHFTNTTTFNVIGEHVGIIAAGSTGADCAPLNPATGAPYFIISAAGWGTGWAAGNALRFNTQGALFPVWIARTIQQGQPTATSDSFTILIRGDVDRP